MFPVHTPVSELPFTWAGVHPPHSHPPSAIQFCIKGHRSAKARERVT